MSKQYVRIGTTYFKRTKKGLKDWSRQAILDDFGKDFLKGVPKYDGFCNEPDHLNYKSEIEGELNMYKALNHKPCAGSWKTIEGFMRHVFGDQYELGLDYIQLLYMKPKQLMPILCLVSEERGTGKTTFGYFLNWIFQGNATKLNQKQLSTEFNASYADKLVCFIDESKISSVNILEGLKDLATSKTIPLRKMRADHVDVDFYCKFLLMSNHTDTFVKIDQQEVRYWIRVLKPSENFCPTFEEDLQDEIPAFLHFLMNREMSVPEKQTRMWFSADQIKTDALESLKNASISSEAKDLVQWLHDLCADNDIKDSIRIPVASIHEDCFSKRVGRKQCGALLNKLFPSDIPYKKAGTNAEFLFTGTRWCHFIPVSEIEDRCVEQGICKKGALVGLPELELTSEEIEDRFNEIP
jgi:hypothetical protein